MVLTCLISLLALVVGLFEYGLVLSILWNWFIPNLFGLPAINWAEALGISLVLGTLRGARITDSSKTTEEKNIDMAWVYIAPLVALVIGWIVKSFFM